MIRTRFPPEPNGYLHLGHLKSIYYNFNYPFDNTQSRETNLRFDDTNSKTEKKEYADAILDDLEWLGYKPDKVFYTSDYFEEIADHTRTLIQKGLVYLDYSTSEEIKEERKTKKESPYRNTSIEETLSVFNEMLYEFNNKNPILRLKIPVEDRTNECMYDPVIYRVSDETHFRTGDKYKAYPTYEYSHYIVDSIEGITHSFCTLEFYVRRPLSFWILDKLELPRMVIEETNRLQTDFGLLSKRKIKAALEQGDLDGWDDPRLLTLRALKRKGFTPEILKEFCAQQGYTKNMNAVTSLESFEAVVRDNLNKEAPRRMGVLNPLKVNLKGIEQKTIKKPLYPTKEDSPELTCYIGPVVYIEKEDFRLEANKKYKRLTPLKNVRLKYAGIIKYISHKTDENGEIIELDAEFIPEKEYDPKVKGKINGTIHWISYPSEELYATYRGKLPLTIWNYPRTGQSEDEYGTKEVTEIMLDYVWGYSEPGNWQLERLGYYHIGCDRTINQLVSLKEDPNKNKK